MASYRGHLTFSTALGAAYSAATFWGFREDWATAILAGGFTAVGGLLPDLDSDSGVPVRELFNWSAAVVPLLFLDRLVRHGFNTEETLVILAGMYLFIRFVLAEVFRRCSVHRGMWHSVPAMLCAGLAVFLCYHDPGLQTRTIMAVGVMIGFLSHLVLDEIYSVDFRGLVPKLNKYAGSALKFYSRSMTANLICFGLLVLLSWLAVQQVQTGSWQRVVREKLRESRSVWLDRPIRTHAGTPNEPAAVPATPTHPEVVPTPSPALTNKPSTPVISVPAWRPADRGKLPAGVVP